ncbi:hypothetical protein [Candidatus Ichthyocystis hellenicum]|uniref:hypothetical protein n=1 Tax=Candidatus Ichthyocystis hellenicum TaxID=1561003 RepID=UPI001584A932|nr:hypothetical protein [Candidatus Ichthyocystis hellenicum]
MRYHAALDFYNTVTNRPVSEKLFSLVAVIGIDVSFYPSVSDIFDSGKWYL